MLVGISLQAQDTLRLEDAVSIALERNYGIIVARNNTQAVENQATSGNAGLLPSVSLSAGANYTLNNRSKVTFNNETTPDIVVNDAASNSQNAGIDVSYTLFDGGERSNNFKVLKTNSLLSEAQLRNVVENTLSQVINAYYQVARLQGSFKILQETMQISRERYRRVKNQLDFGATNRLAVLNAQVDMNTDSVNLATAQINLANAKRDFNVLVGREVDAGMLPSSSTEVLELGSLNEVQENALKNSSSLQVADYNLIVSRLNERVTQAAKLPRVDLSGAYNYTRSDAGPGGFLRLNETFGMQVGATLSYNIFDGNSRGIRIQNAKLDVLSREQDYEEAKAGLLRDINNAYYTFQNSQTILELEKKSLEAAQLNFERTQDAFKLGQSTSVQFREAQLNLLQVNNRLNDLRYDIKINETELLRLTGRLVSAE